MSDKGPNKEIEIMLAEYAAAHNDYIHNDTFPWQVGAILIAGTFVFWGLLLDIDINTNKTEPRLTAVGSLFVTLLLSVWILYTHHCRQIYLQKLHRIHQIEALCGMKQHLGWIKIERMKHLPGSVNPESVPSYCIFGLSGRQLNTFIYILGCIGAPMISVLKFGMNLWFALPLIVVILVLLWIRHSEVQIQNHLNHLYTTDLRCIREYKKC